MSATSIIILCAMIAFVWCLCDLSPKVLLGVALLCALELITIFAWEYSHLQTCTTSHFGTCYTDWSGNKVYINEEKDHIRIVDYNTPNEVLNYYTLDKGDNKIEK